MPALNQLKSVHYSSIGTKCIITSVPGKVPKDVQSDIHSKWGELRVPLLVLSHKIAGFKKFDLV